mmetsp:Transcript_9406/g.9208  ORF Transcript_9406/g.9208 Transcript_9406/m.9208 type:complete len:194 (-) Transcript_9406:74-655(-)|eukprot:CAMPEP_0119051392 /NCGR_PEP_ID=MMETSP1177-20130426/73025_1 /TAXON_ID=2985 /ORGANISM="Ochromonas sp, Strain CCMP1899" /LENGTH=193 /DNA_ID=CAMNT_0007030579 /DNA_START=46 /DNA_END=627 /DNA_ORIENTATION=+
MRQSSGSSSDIVDIIDIIRRKLRDSKTKIATVIQKCDEKDRNNDGLIHVDDLEDIFNEVMGTEYRITRRELKKFVNTFMFEDNSKVEYSKISDILEPHKSRGGKEKEVKIEEKWLDNAVEEEDIRWATQPGSVGEFLKKAACPAEIANFRTFVNCLERFERDSGMKIQLKADGGFTVPMGPDLRASISFYMPS